MNEREDYIQTYVEQEYKKEVYIFRQGNEHRNIYYVG